MKSPETKKIAIVCDWIKDWGGAELVLSHILELFPQADIYTSVFWQQKNPVFQNYTVNGKNISSSPYPTFPQGEKEQATKAPNITTSFIQNIPFLNTSHKLALTLRPLAFESFDLSSYDIVISCSSAESKGVITKPGCLHICYCHTPTRYFWSHYHEYMSMMEFGMLNPLARWLMPKMIHRLRKWDFCAAQRPDFFLANSENTARRIKKYYDREASVLYPGIEIASLSQISSVPSLPQVSPPIQLSPKGRKNKPQEDFYLAVGRCIPYKKFDLLVEAFNKNGKHLVCVTNTDNKLFRKLRKISKANIEWKVNISREETQELFASAKAFLFPPEEDFGLVPLEAMACGTPVIAYEKGGALETVIPPYPTFPQGEKERAATGVFFMEQTSQSLNAVIEIFETLQFDSESIKKHAETFSREIFQEKLMKFIESKLENV